MLVASTMGATAFQKGLGAMHSLSHPCSANLNTHHGLTNGVVMPYVLVFNRRAIKDKMKRLAAYIGLRRASFPAVLDWILELRQTIGIPHALSALGVTEAHIATFAKMAMADPSTSSNPVRLNPRKFEQLYRNAVIGTLS
jgi:alcohol dehydrogenase class IV